MRQGDKRVYFRSAVAGDNSLKFQNTTQYNGWPNDTGFRVGSYVPVEDSALGSSLVFSGDEWSGNFTLTDNSGAIFTYLAPGSQTGMALESIVYPDGTTINLTYDGPRPKRVESSRGYAIIFEYASGPDGNQTMSAACAVNLAVDEVAQAADCPSGKDKVQYSYGMVQITQKRQNKPTVYFDKPRLLTVTDRSGAQTNYSHDDGGHVDCITDPGQSVCRVQLSYSECSQDATYEEGAPNAIFAEMHLIERVLSQVYADGSRYDYTYPSLPSVCPDQFDDGFPKSGIYSFQDTNGDQTTVDLTVGRPLSITDKLGRITVQQRTHLISYQNFLDGSGVVSGKDLPDGKRLEWTYDDRGNTLTTRRVTSDGTSFLEFSASFPATCANVKTCNQPTSTTDPNGNVTDFVYDPAHGGILKTTGPADDNGIRPETRYSYVQKYAWLKSGSGYVQAATPIWVLASEEYCRTSAADANGNCAAGAGDEVVTTYEYEAGSATKGSNIHLLGMAVTAGGQTLRTCYGYDDQGRRIFETQPKAGLATCQS